MGRGAYVSKFYKTFSGTDTIAFLMFPGINPIVIGSLTTISYSMYRNKVPVINIGRTNINGITRGSRIYAGTMVFTLVNKHWVRELQDQVPYLSEFTTIKTDELPLFDIMIVSANEYGNGCCMFIYGVDFTDEAQTLSVEDLFTENIFKFVAREVAVFDETKISVVSEGQTKYYTINTGIIKNYYVDEQARQTAIYKIKTEIRPLGRTLYYSVTAPIIGEDVAAVQQLLNLALDYSISITYKYDRKTERAVKDFQTTVGLIVNGVVDNNTYTKLIQYTKEESDGNYVQIINKSGAYLYRFPNTNSSITKILPYLSSVKTLGKEVNKGTNGNTEKFYKTQDGYLSLYDAYDYTERFVMNISGSEYIDKTSDSYTYELIKYNDEGPQVTVLQNALQTLYPKFNEYKTGRFDENTENYLKLFQSQNGLEQTGVADYYTWNILLGKVDQFKDNLTINYDVQCSKEPGTYSFDTDNINTLDSFVITIKSRNLQQVKYSVLSVYPDGSTKTDAKILLCEGTQNHSLDEFRNMFVDDVEHKTPTDVYYIIYPYGSIPYKWHFKIEEDN
jgi:peptidoglycan hydrolase-like protein with peptidoglycan-binding domain